VQDASTKILREIQKCASKALRRGDLSALADLKSHAEEGHSWCYHALGDIYLFGRYGAVRNEELGKHYLQLGFESGIQGSGHLLARHLQEDGKVADAKVLYEKLSAEYYPPSMFQLGKGCLRGDWGEVDEERGLSLLEKAADLGHFPSADYLHWFLLRRPGRNRDRLLHLALLYIAKFKYLFYQRFFAYSPKVKM
jgi:TPR repeat protein